MPTIKAKFRMYRGVPFAIEKIAGTQYRCRRCNSLFLKKEELYRHLQNEAKESKKELCDDKCPKIDENTKVTVLYINDLHDQIRSDYLHMQEGFTYDHDP